eukprot:9504069-Pyramimonas_sp.AAC.3
MLMLGWLNTTYPSLLNVCVILLTVAPELAGHCTSKGWVGDSLSIWRLRPGETQAFGNNVSVTEVIGRVMRRENACPPHKTLEANQRPAYMMQDDG